YYPFPLSTFYTSFRSSLYHFFLCFTAFNTRCITIHSTFSRPLTCAQVVSGERARLIQGINSWSDPLSCRLKRHAPIGASLLMRFLQSLKRYRRRTATLSSHRAPFCCSIG